MDTVVFGSFCSVTWSFSASACKNKTVVTYFGVGLRGEVRFTDKEAMSRDIIMSCNHRMAWLGGT